MAELSYRATDVRRADGSFYLWIARGWVDEPADVRGADGVVALKAGRRVNPRYKDRRVVELRGQLKAATAAAMFTLANELRTLFDPTITGALVAGDLYRGLGAGQTATLQARTINVVPGDRTTGFHRLYTIELECVASPPEWVVA